MGPTASAAILCGDPARALMIAQRVLVEPRMSNHHRGLWSYCGATAEGSQLTVQATGIGGPSAALVLTLLARAGLRTAIRVGSCHSLGGEPALGAPVVATSILPRDGASAAYGAVPGRALVPDPELTAALLGADTGVALTSLDRPADESADDAAPDDGPFDLQSGALLAAAQAAGVRLAVAAVVSRNSSGPLADETLEARALGLAERATAALAITETSPPVPSTSA